ncbi:MAG: mannitol-/sugar-/sorbitol-6-/2-deoxyglucose-6-phosphatase [Acidobacteriota bacterium]|jgi:sugar-phosphatase|nr:mannitol-/sugar-/sorbitol-6-/2-deoxyglucose-6-phosphatase [Acidobacteriota bacterium]
MSSPPRALIFDMDGVLIHSEPLWHEAEIATAGEAGLELTPEDCLRTTGLRVDEVVAWWCERDPALAPRQEILVASILDRLVDLVTRRGTPKPGVDEVLAFARSRGLRLALASSSPYRVINAALDALGLHSAFEVIHSAEEEARGKPDPAVYLTTARKLGIEPERCIAVEDSPNGLLSAKAAGMQCIVVPELALRADPRFALADARVAELGEIGPELLSSLLQ